MKYILSRSNFLNESRKKSGEETIKSDKKANVKIFEKDIMEILDGHFAKVTKPIFKYGVSEFPTSIEFEVSKNDYVLDYKKPKDKADKKNKEIVMINDFSVNVAKKREFLPIIYFNSKREEKVDSDMKYYVKFNIDKSTYANDLFKQEDEKDIESYTNKELIKKYYTLKTTPREKDAIDTELKGREIDVEDYANKYDVEKK